MREAAKTSYSSVGRHSNLIKPKNAAPKGASPANCFISSTSVKDISVHNHHDADIDKQLSTAELIISFEDCYGGSITEVKKSTALSNSYLNSGFDEEASKPYRDKSTICSGISLPGM